MDAEAALERLCAEAGRGELVFPTHLEAALKLQEALADPDCPLETAVARVQAEPLIAARLVAIANSVAYTRYGGHVTQVRAALSVIGFRPLRALVAAIVVRQMNQAIRDAELRRQADLLWRHSAHVASLAKEIARELTAFDPETALFAGIVHEIDGFYALSRVESMPALREVAAWGNVAPLRRQLSQAVLAALKVPRPVAQTVTSLFEEAAPGGTLTLGEVLRLAHTLTPFASPLEPAGAVVAVDEMLSQRLAPHADEIAAQFEALMV